MAIELITILSPQLIPVWFYGYGAVAYGIVAAISFLISLFSFKLYRKSSLKTNLVLSLSFLSLGIAFACLLVSSLYTYFYIPYFQDDVGLGFFNHSAFNFYYLASLISYILFSMMYLPGKIKNKFFAFYVPLWYIDWTNFHILSIFIIGYVLLMNFMNCYKKRNFNSYLVTFAFFTIEIFHLLLLFIPFDVSLYLAAHALLSVGFGSLLIMLIRVSVK